MTDTKKYSVFISSTYEDLQEERKTVIEALLTMNCFPIGMEFFNAFNDSQWDVIKSLIEESDYYVLIIAGRYGTIEESTGKSYTQKEYEYAKSIGVPILTFIHGDMGKIPSQWIETDANVRLKHEAFLAEAKTRLCKFWKSPDDLSAKVIQSLVSAFRANPRIGWIRADVVTAEDANKELLRLRAENDALHSEMRQLEENAPRGTEMLAQGDDLYEVHFDWYDEDCEYEDGHDNFSWNQIFECLAPYMVVECAEYLLENHFQNLVRDYVNPNYKHVTKIYDRHFQDVKVQFMALGLITKSLSKKAASNTQIYWTLTPYGQKVMMQLKAIKRSN